MHASSNKRRRRIGLLSAFFACFMAMTGAAVAQTDEPDDTIIVTGTRIPRPDAEAPSPIASFEREDINRFREVTVEEFINTLPQVAPDFGRTSNNPGEGTASIDLRGLGRSRTLVLLNGRRLAPTGAGTAIDINTLPGTIIKRVEIVTGGASAVYGSDAVTGAVNFLVRDDFEGLELSGQFDIYGAGDGEAYNAGVVAGKSFSDGGGHVVVYADYLNLAAILSDVREFTNVVIGEDRVAGVLLERGSPVIPEGFIFDPPAVLNGEPVQLVFNSDGTVRARTPADSFNFAPHNFLQTPVERWSSGLFANYEAASGVKLFTELMFARPVTSAQLAPTPDFFFAPIVIDAPFFADSARPILSAAYDPDGDGVGEGLLVKRFEDLGPRRILRTRESYRGVAGLRAELSRTWSLEAYYSYARNETRETLGNAASRSRILQGLLVDPATGGCVDPSGGCVPVNLFGVGVLSDEAKEFIHIDDFTNRDEAVQHIASLAATGELFEWSGGSAWASAGVEFRRNRAAFIPSEIFLSGDAIGFRGNQPIAGDVNVYEIFAETLLPLIQGSRFIETLEVEAGGRFSHYSTAGSVWTWKAGGQWRPFENLRFRGMFQQAVRAPNVAELFTSPTGELAAIDGADDFCAALNDPVGRGLADVCVAQGMDPAALGVYAPAAADPLFFTMTTRGNPDLGVERASTITAGGEYTFDLPFLLRVGADYFSANIDNAISLVENPFQLCPVTRDVDGPVCSLIMRTSGGAPLEGINKPVNISVARANGVDLNLVMEADAPSWLRVSPDATLSLQSFATVYFERGSALAAETPFVDCAGGFAAACTTLVGLDQSAGVTFPDNLVVTSLSYGTPRWTASLRWRRIGAIENFAPIFDALAGAAPPNLPIPHVGSRNYLDIAFSADVAENVRLRFGVDNILATDPPQLADEQAQANTDPSRYDVLGRRVHIGAELRFGGN